MSAWLTKRPRQKGPHFADEIFTCIFLNENVWISIKLSLKITLGNIYRPPKFNNSNPTIEDVMLELNHIMNELSNENSYAICTGDFTINLSEINLRLKYQAFFDPFATQRLYKNCTTHKIYKKGSIHDNIFVDICKSYSATLLSYISDHLSPFTCLDIHKSNKQTRNKHIMIETKDKDSIKLFHDDIQSSFKYKNGIDNHWWDS